MFIFVLYIHTLPSSLSLPALLLSIFAMLPIYLASSLYFLVLFLILFFMHLPYCHAITSGYPTRLPLLPITHIMLSLLLSAPFLHCFLRCCLYRALYIYTFVTCVLLIYLLLLPTHNIWSACFVFMLPAIISFLISCPPYSLPFLVCHSNALLILPTPPASSPHSLRNSSTRHQ